MKFTCPTDKLAMAAATLARITKPNSVLNMVYIEATDGKVTMVSEGMVLSISATIQAEVEEPGLCAVDARNLAETTGKLISTSTSCEATGESLVIKSGGSRIRLPVIREKSLKAMPTFDGYEAGFTVDGEAFCGCVERVRHAVAGENSTRVLLTGILTEVTPGSLKMVACDGFRMALNTVSTDEATEAMKVIIPSKSATEMVGIIKKELAGKVHFSTDGKSLVMEAGAFMVRTALLMGVYLDYERLLPKQFATQALARTADLRAAVDILGVIAMSSKNTPITARFGEEELSMSASSDDGSANDVIGCEMTGNPLEISFNGHYLADALKSFDAEQVIISCNSDITPAIIRDSRPESGMLCLILPVKVFR